MDSEYKRLKELQEMSDKFIDEQLKNEKLQADLIEMRKNYEEKCEIVSILRQQIAEVTSGLDDIETSHETLKALNDNLKTRNNTLEEENKTLSDLVASLKDENESLNQRYESRTEQTSDLAMKLMSAKVELEEKTNELSQNMKEIEMLKQTIAENQNRDPDETRELSDEIHNLRTKNRALINQLKQIMEERKQVKRKEPIHYEEKEEPIEELYNLRAQNKALRHQLSERSRDEDLANLRSELHITETSWNMEKLHKERYARENAQLERTLAELNKRLSKLEGENLELKDKLSKKRLPVSNLPIADEVGEIMDSSTLPTQNKRPMHDPLERVNELARRNQLQKPLHQSSYALELETFDKMDISYDEIKRGNLKQRTALADHSNHRKIAQKPMAFTVEF